MRAKTYHINRQALSGNFVLGIDPGKQNHSSVVLDASGLPQGTAFSYPVSREGFDKILPVELQRRIPGYGPENLVVAVETSCNLWLTIAWHFHTQGYRVVLVSPVATRHARPMLDNDFSKSDPKDALLVADNAQRGNYTRYRTFAKHIEAAHQLSITYDKLAKDRTQVKCRLRSFMERVFPEYLGAFDITTNTSLYLLERYFLPQHFLQIDVQAEGEVIRKISQGSHKAPTLRKLKTWAQTSIGVGVDGQEEALRIILDGWIDGVRRVEQQLERVKKAMIERVRDEWSFDILTSLPNINENLAAQFIAETRGPNRFGHFKEIEKLAGNNVRISDSGKFKGRRRISKMGNPRLRRVVYQMTTQTAKVVPQVRRRFLRRELKKKCYRKNIVASSSQLLRLIVALLKERRPYEERPDLDAHLAGLERKYEARYKKKRRPRNTRVAA